MQDWQVQAFQDCHNFWHGYIRFATKGEVGAWRKSVGPRLAGSSLSDPIDLSVHLQLLRYERRYAEIVNVLRQLPMSSLPAASYMEDQIFDSVGNRPLAEYRGWAYLLLDDRPHAQEQGRAVLAFVAQQPKTEWNRFFLRLLEAEGYTFTAQKSEAIAAARSALELMPRTRNAVAWIGVASIGARVYAWNGAGDDAVKLLEELTDSAPGLQPALVARDPLFTIPLARSAGFESLRAKLEEQMRNAPL